MSNQIWLTTLSGPVTRGEDGLFWVEAIRCGAWDYPKPGIKGFEITPSVITELHENFQAGIMGKEIVLNVDHKPGTDCGWVKATKIGTAGKSLWTGFDCTDPAIEEKVVNGTLKFSSSELDLERVCPELSAKGDSKPRKVLEGLALTNHPYIKGMAPVSAVHLCDRATQVALSEGVHFPTVMNDGENVDADEKRVKADMPEITLTEALAQIEAQKVRLAALESNTDAKASLAETLRLSGELKLRDTEDSVRRLVRKGKLTPAVANLALRLSEILIRGQANIITLAEPLPAAGRKYTLAEGDDQGISKLDVIGEVIDMLGQLPDAVAMDAPGRAALTEEDDEDDKKGDDDAKDMEEAEKIEAAEKLRGKPRDYAVILSEVRKKNGRGRKVNA